ncbi:NAC domain containing protein 52-like [Argentina anserina]|uniref:NAC domain containing protein 52-like n=1 Tax=Argentina anserina TaxID=57926 RepID=UPI0021767BC9|nr:NAC domain containing protein 52-like [Potentilla anserina]
MGHELVPSTATPPVLKPPAAPTALAPGFRFHPTDEELVIYYLKRKVCRKPFKFNAISDVDIYKSEPWDLACKSSLKSRDQEYYFFSALDKKYGNGARMNRATNLGYWKATGNDRPVKHNGKTVGMKKTLVFHSGRAPDGKRTNWVMHEYRLVDTDVEKPGNAVPQDAYVLCRVFHKSNIGPPNGHRYAPFIEEEWDDEKLTFIPGEVARDDSHDTVAAHDSIGNNRDVVMLGSGHHSVGGYRRDVVTVGNDPAVGGNHRDFLMMGNGLGSVGGGNHRHTVMAGNGHDSAVGGNWRDAIVIGNGHHSVVGGATRDAGVMSNGGCALVVGNGNDKVVGAARYAAIGGNGHATACIEHDVHDSLDIDKKDHVAVVVEQKENASASVEQKDHNVCLGGNGHGPSVDGHVQETMMEVDDHGNTNEGNVHKSIEGNGLEGRSAGNYVMQDTQTISNALLSATELPKDDQTVLKPCKIENLDDDPVTCVVNREERLDDYPSPRTDDPQPLLSLFNQQPGILRQYKRRRHNESNSNRSNASEISSGLTHDPCSSTTTTASTEASVTATTKRNFLSALVEFQLLESIEPKDKTPVAPPEFNAALHSSSVPSSCLKFIESLQNEIHKISIEKETLKFEMLSAQAVINILQSRIDLLTKENEDLKRNAGEAE